MSGYDALGQMPPLRATELTTTMAALDSFTYEDVVQISRFWDSFELGSKKEFAHRTPWRGNVMFSRRNLLENAFSVLFVSTCLLQCSSLDAGTVTPVCQWLRGPLVVCAHW